MEKPRIQYLLFELGRLQVFWYPNQEDLIFNRMPTEVFWLDARIRQIHGPFQSIWLAVYNYTELEKRQVEIGTVKPPIYVDFINKQRVKFDKP